MCGALGDFFAHESCGKCYPCQMGTQRQAEILHRVPAAGAVRPTPPNLLELAAGDDRHEHLRAGPGGVVGDRGRYKRWPEMFADAKREMRCARLSFADSLIRKAYHVRSRTQAAHEETRDAWNANVAHWDERMGEGNDFVNVLIWPAPQRMLDLRPDSVCWTWCGNGLYARRLAALGAEVVATDFAAEMIAHAQARPAPAVGKITYAVLDATDESAFGGLGEGAFGERPSTRRSA